jgi:uncharacterized protein (DUF2249 family)
MLSFDMRKTLIPFSLLKITNLFQVMKPGETLEIVADADPTNASTLRDVLLVLPYGRYDLISMENVMLDRPVIRLRLRKTISTPNKRKEPHHE